MEVSVLMLTPKLGFHFKFSDTGSGPSDPDFTWHNTI